MPWQLDVYGISDVGLVRSNNEDAWSEVSNAHFFAIADGMGGHRAGEVAARIAIMSICKTVEEASHPLTVESAVNLLRSGVKTANSIVYAMSESNEKMRGMGTTLSCLVLLENTLVYAHVGDSRIYRFRNKHLEQLTQDHSLRNEVIARGEFFDESLMSLPKNVITRAIGTSSKVEPEISAFPFFPKDLYFLCSDGLTDNVSSDEITQVLSRGCSIKSSAEMLISLAKENGGSDNITIVMIQVS